MPGASVEAAAPVAMGADVTFKSNDWWQTLALTKEQHDELMTTRRRPITQGPMRPVERIDDGNNDGHSVVDEWIKHTKGNR